MRATKLIILGCIAALTACTVNPYTGEEQASNAAKYGAGAAVICALVGAMDSREKARNAALGCGLVGAGVGAYMDVQEAKLRDQLAGSGVRVVREGDNIRLVMPGSITFETDSYNLRQDFFDELDSVALVLAKYTDTTLRISGHTDNTGSRAYNQQLSENRAQNVTDYLVSREVVHERIYVQGLAFDQPIADNSSADGRARNRRVELTILPSPS
ncbi:MAG: outer membrane protein OmpA-like peptidoglycan-associated protein [Bacteroidia bacterium]|jgi:outer membrane protein OmpA-like peptidoglycan-associated protein